jgi:hypothetical protein
MREPATWSEAEILTSTRPKIPINQITYQLMNSCTFFDIVVQNDWLVFLTILEPSPTFSRVQSYTLMLSVYYKFKAG